jgi:hypothetical protein
MGGSDLAPAHVPWVQKLGRHAAATSYSWMRPVRCKNPIR